MNGKVAVKLLMQMIMSALFLFLPAGTVSWAEGWIFFVLWFTFMVIVIRMLAGHNPALLEERFSPLFQKGQQGWDKGFVLAYVLIRSAWLILMGVDAVRFGWSAVPLGLKLLGAWGLLLSLRIMYLTFRENAYLSPVVKIQADRGHQVVTTGPYSLVRHPLYLADIINFPSVSLLLGSWYGLALSLLLILIFIVRTALEDQVLTGELAGYGEYARSVKYRLIPHVW